MTRVFLVGVHDADEHVAVVRWWLCACWREGRPARETGGTKFLNGTICTCHLSFVNSSAVCSTVPSQMNQVAGHLSVFYHCSHLRSLDTLKRSLHYITVFQGNAKRKDKQIRFKTFFCLKQKGERAIQFSHNTHAIALFFMKFWLSPSATIRIR